MHTPHDWVSVFLDWFPMLILVGVWLFIMFLMRGGSRWTPQWQKDQIEALRETTKVLERIAIALEKRPHV